MKKLSILLSTMLVSVLVALTYHFFEQSVHHSINYIWNELFDTEGERLLIIPICIVLTLSYFGLQHYLDPKSENNESKGLGAMSVPTLANYGKVLLIGFFSLIAGASLGPEAILVPACMIVGGFVGTKLYGDKPMVKLLSAVGFIALFAAFFDSFIAGLLGLLLVSKQAKTKLDIQLFVIGIIASLTTVLTLEIFSAKAFIDLSQYHWKLTTVGTLVFALLIAGGYLYTYLLSYVHKLFSRVHDFSLRYTWWFRGLVAAAGLSAIYLVGGPLIEFTGNASVAPMLQQAKTLGVMGLLGLFLIKTIAIGWSKALGYRGGLVFPSIFVAATLSAIVGLFTHEISFVVSSLAVIIGMMAADSKVKILF